MMEIQLYDGTKTIIDNIDADLMKYNWFRSNGYVATRIDGTFTYLHRLILSRKEELPFEYADHINRNVLDNRRCNLRPANGCQNTRNRGK